MNEIKTITVTFEMKGGNSFEIDTYGTGEEFSGYLYKRKDDSFIKLYSITTERDIFINLKEVETVSVEDL